MNKFFITGMIAFILAVSLLLAPSFLSTPRFECEACGYTDTVPHEVCPRCFYDRRSS